MRRLKPDDGFTLIELLVVTSVLGMVFLAVSGMFTTAVVSHRQAEHRVSDAQDAQNVGTYFAGDVQGAFSAATGLGTTPAVGGVVVRFSMRDFDAGTHVIVDWSVSYEWAGSDLHRVSSRGSDIVVARGLEGASFDATTWTLTLTGKDHTYAVRGTRRVT